MDKAFEMDQIRRAITAILDHFPKYLDECKRNWPTCPNCRIDLCQVLKKDCNPYYQCFQCMHKEWGI